MRAFALDLRDQSQERLKEIAARSPDRLSPYELKEVPEKRRDRHRIYT